MNDAFVYVRLYVCMYLFGYMNLYVPEVLRAIVNTGCHFERCENVNIILPFYVNEKRIFKKKQNCLGQKIGGEC